ncbi:MAG: hypothetical protein RMI89_07955 [Gloeomargarita sp. SKYBB_i_bin120]|nr:hypothetical protein [Gloeomargarita sp. SKYG98]MCS7292892.1 hypothetical protein [Gloeomargarita sp. SKYB120]MDW8178455.1 hypothetical protein [Gloeomargarita sp. SKYBB_i_bin120]
MGRQTLLALGLVLALGTPAGAQVSQWLAPRRQNEYQGPAAEPTSPLMNMMEFINHAAFRASTRSLSEFMEDAQGDLSRAVEAFRAKQRQLLNPPATSVEVQPKPAP